MLKRTKAGLEKINRRINRSKTFLRKVAPFHLEKKNSKENTQ